MLDTGTNAGQIGVLVKSVLEGLVPAVEAAVRQQFLPPLVADDNRNLSSISRAPPVDPDAFDDTDGFGFEGNIPVHSLGAMPSGNANAPSFSRLRARAQAFEYVDLSEFLMTESTSQGRESQWDSHCAPQ